MGTPTVAGFTSFVRNIMGITTAQLPADAPILTYSMNVSLATVYLGLVNMPSGIPDYWTPYELAVYNLAGDLLVNYAPDNSAADPPDNTYFTTLRASMHLNSFVAGVIATTFDQGTGETMVTPEFMKNLTLSDLQRLKTPWGRAYLQYAQAAGPLWGLS